MDNVKNWIKKNGHEKSEIARKMARFTFRRVSKYNIDYYLNKKRDDIPADVVKFFMTEYGLTELFIRDKDNADDIIGIDPENLFG